MTKSTVECSGSSVLDGARAGLACSSSLPRDVFRLSGRDALDLLHRLSTNDVGNMAEGEVRETLLTTEKGRIIDLLLLARFSDGLFVLCSAGRGRAVADWVEKFTITDDVTIQDIRYNHIVTWIYGHKALSAMVDAVGGQLQANRCLSEDRLNLRLIALENPRGSHIVLLGGSQDRDAVLARCDLEPLSPEKAELLRVRSGIPSWPNELNEGHNPYDVGLVDLISFAKGCYVGQEVIARLDTYEKVRRGLVGVEFVGESPGAVPAAVHDQRGEIGMLTSVAPDHEHRNSYGLAVVKLKHLKTGDEVQVYSGSATVRGRVSTLPRELRRS